MGPSGGMVDAGDSKSPAARRAGSSPALGTNYLTIAIKITVILIFYVLVVHFEKNFASTFGASIWVQFCVSSTP